MKKITALAFVLVLLVTGCTMKPGDITSTECIEDTFYAENEDYPALEDKNDLKAENINNSGYESYIPMTALTMEGLLAKVSKAKFNETITPELATSWDFIGFISLAELYIPFTTESEIEF